MAVRKDEECSDGRVESFNIASSGYSESSRELGESVVHSIKYSVDQSYYEGRRDTATFREKPRNEVLTSESHGFLK